ncbi:MAG: lysostaphin resistance A-like protein [Pleurocapsa sp.]
MLNASWFKVLTFFGVWAAVWLPIAFLVSRFIDWQPSKIMTTQQKLVLLASLYILLPVVIGWKIKVESLSFATLGLSALSKTVEYILLGLTLSLVSLIVVFGLETAFKLISWHQQNMPRLIPLFFPILGLSLLISLVEEIVFRGYVFSTLSIDNSSWIAATISSTIFALLHLIWERKQTLPQIPGLWLMGMVLVAARVLGNGSIYLALGLHAGWICGLTCIDSAELITYSDQSHWFTGINQQPLAGIAGIFCLAITGIAIWGIIDNGLFWF